MATPLKKTEPPSPRSQLLSIAAELGMRTAEPLPLRAGMLTAFICSCGNFTSVVTFPGPEDTVL